MKQLLVATALLCMLSCNKNSIESNFSGSKKEPIHTPLPLSDNSLFKTVDNTLKQYNPAERLLKIDSILFLKYKEDEARLVYYHSNLGTSNILLQGINDGNETYAAASTKCQGSCNCVLEVLIKNDGSASLSCSCSDCLLISHGSVEEVASQ